MRTEQTAVRRRDVVRIAFLASVIAAGGSALANEAIVIKASVHQRANAQSVAFSPDGHLVAAGFGGPSNGRFPLKPLGGRVVVWNADSGKLVTSSGEYGDTFSLQFTSDSKAWLHSRVYTPGDSVDDNVCRLVRVADGKIAPQPGWNRNSHIAVASPIRPQIVIGQASDIGHVFKVTDDGLLQDTKQRLKVAGSHYERRFAFSTDGSVFVAAYCVFDKIADDVETTAAGHTVRLKGLTVFDAESWSVRKSIIVKSEELHDCTALTVSPGGNWIATGHSNGIVRVWDGQGLKVIRELNLQTTAAVLPQFSPDGKTLAVLTQPAKSPTWKYADTASGFEVGRRQTGRTCDLVLFDSGSLRERRRFRFEDGVFETFHANSPPESLNPTRMAFSPDSKRILVGCNGVVLIDVETGAVMRQFHAN